MNLKRSQSSDNLSSWESRVDKPKMSWDSSKPWPTALPESRPRISWDSKPWMASKERLHRDQMINKAGGLMCKERSPRVAPERDFLVLPPPPCRSDSTRRRSVHVGGYGGGNNLIIPGILQPPGMRSSPIKGFLKREEDPFLAAYIECTKSVKPIKESGKKGGFLGLISCKRGSCGDVREEGVVKVSQMPAPAAAHPGEMLKQKEMEGV